MTSALPIAPPERRPQSGSGPAPPAEVLTSDTELAAIEADWRSLAEARGNAFVTPEWFHAWREASGRRAEPFVVVVRDGDGSVRGVVPLKVAHGRVPVLRFAGSSLGDVFHPACALEDEELVGAGLAGALAAHRDAWSVATFHNTEVGARWLGPLATEGLVLSYGQATAAPHVDVRGETLESFLAGRGRKLRKNLGNYRRRIERELGLSFRMTTHPGEAYADVQHFLHLHEARFRRGSGSLLASAPARAFHLAFARRALARGWLRLWFMEAGGQPIASSLSWRLGPTYSDYNGGFDPRYARFSPGLVLLAHELAAAIGEGAETYDLLLGNEPYKRRFTETERQVRTALLAPPAHPHRLGFVAQLRVREAIDALPDAVGDTLVAAARPLARRLPTSRTRA